MIAPHVQERLSREKAREERRLAARLNAQADASASVPAAPTVSGTHTPQTPATFKLDTSQWLEKSGGDIERFWNAVEDDADRVAREYDNFKKNLR